jgi:carbonic anhydrase/acetyltransferase-like protein (isoleucine patch superfamily)
MIRSFEGKTPVIAESAFVSEAAYVIGDVEIGEGSGVFPGAVIRGDFASIKIGRNTMVEDNSVIHSGGPVIIGDNVTIGHSVVVHCSRIGNNCLIGNNATVLDDTEIGSFCIIAAGCLVRQGIQIPDNSFVVGVPGEIKGQVPTERWERRRRGRGGYSELLKRYKEQEL